MTKIILLLALFVQTPPADPLATASDFIKQVLETFPAWEKDKLAQYEQAELAVVRRDLVIVMSDIVEDDVLQDTARLDRDWKALVSLDNKLKAEDVI